MFTHLTDAQVKRELKLYKNQKHFYLQTKVFIMNKKYLSALLIGAITVASTSTFVSCKDYDDDIDELHALVDQNSSALQAAKAALEGEIASLKTQLEAKDAELASLIQAANAATAENKEAIAKEVLRAIEAEAALEARIVTAEKAIADIQAVLANKVNKDEFESTVKDIYAKLETVTNGLGEAMKSIEGLQKGLEDEETARKAVAADLAQQVAALEALTKRVAAIEGDYLKAADKKALEDKIKEVSDALKAEAEKVATNAASIEALKKTAESLSNMVDELSAELNTLNVFVKGTLRSIVFIPDSYYWGIEATSIKYLSYDIYTLGAANVDKKLSSGGSFSGANGKTGEVNDIHNATKVRPHTPSATSKTGSTILNFVAKYHLNPSNAELKDAKFTILSGDKDYINTRATGQAPAQLFYKSHSIANGDLSVNIDVNKPELIKSVPANQKVTVFATQITLNNGGKQDTTITSDYATLYADHIKDIVISHTKPTMTKVVNEHCGGCTVSGKDKLHLFATAKEAAGDFEPQDTCDWDKTLDLRKLVEIHYTDVNGTHKLMEKDLIESNGLEFKFELVGLWYGSNTTSESAHAAINPEDGYTFRPQMVSKEEKNPDGTTKVEGGKQMPYGSEISRVCIGRTPLVRVSLVNSKGEVLDYGFIRIRISETVIPSEPQPDKKVSYKKPGTESYSFDICTQNFKNWSYKNRWDQIEHDIYKLVGLSKEEFDAHYHAVAYVDEAGNELQELQQYKYDNKTKKFSTISYNQKKGVVVEVPNDGVEETTVLQWSLTKEDVERLFFDRKNLKQTHTTDSIAIKYQSDNEYVYESVYVVLNTNTFDIKVLWPKATINWADARIANYWYEFGSMNRGTYEIRTNTLSPEDEDVENLKGVPFDNLFSDVFQRNQVISSAYVKLENAKYNDINWTLVFDKKNNGKKFNGITGSGKKEYTLLVGDSELGEGKALYAYINSALDKELIATLVYKEGAEQTPNNTIIQYAHTEYAYALLNYKSHLEISDAESTKDILDIIVSLDAKMCERSIDVVDNFFNVRFLRPINVINSEYEVTDAATDALQIINIRDLVTLSDWRSTEDNPIWRNENKDYWNYYQIKRIEIVGGDNLEEGSYIDDCAYTNLNKDANEEPKKTTGYLLGNVSKQVRFKHYATNPNNDICDFDENNAANYGYLEYKNLSSTVDKFQVLIPLKVVYEWGYVYLDVTVTVNRTAGNAKPRN